MLAPLSVAAAILAILCALSLGVIPNISREPESSRPRHAWLDVWLPLLATLPVAAAALLGQQAGLAPAFILWVLAAGSLAAAAVICGMALLDSRLAPGQPVVDPVHVLAIFALGVVLLGAAYVGRLPDWMGHIFLTAAVLWLWTLSSEPGSAGQSAPSGDALFLLDWSGPLASPVRLRWKVIVAAGLLIAAGGVAWHQLHWLWSGVQAGQTPPSPSPSLSRWIIVLALAGQWCLLIALWRVVGARAALRSSVSTSVLSVLAVIGVMCVGLIPWRAIISREADGSDAAWQVRDLLGLSILAPAGLTALALLPAGVAHRLDRRARAVMAWLVIALALAGALAGALLVRRSWS